MQIDVAAVVARRHDQQHVPPVAVAEPHERVAHPEGLFDPPMTATTTGLPDGVRGVGKKFFFPPPWILSTCAIPIPQSESASVRYQPSFNPFGRPAKTGNDGTTNSGESVQKLR